MKNPGNIIVFAIAGAIVAGFVCFGIGACFSRSASIIAGEWGSILGLVAGGIFGSTRQP